MNYKRQFSLVLFMFFLFSILLASHIMAADEFKVVELLNSIRKPAKKCPVEFSFRADIRVNRPGTVMVQWVRSDGVTSKPIKLVFTKFKLKQSIPYKWLLNGTPGDHKRLFKTRLVVLKPLNIRASLSKSNWAGANTYCRPGRSRMLDR